MNALEITMGATAIANAIACGIADNNTLALVGAVFTELGDTLTTISLQRVLCAAKESAGKNPGADSASSSS